MSKENDDKTASSKQDSVTAEENFTSPPWSLTHNAKTGVKIWGKGKLIAIVKGDLSMSHVSPDKPMPEWRANASLMRMAPEMYQQLVRLQEFLQKIYNFGDGSEDMIRNVAYMMEENARVLKKSRGEI